MSFSYHTFLLPFLWNSSKKVNTMDDFVRFLRNDSRLTWVQESQDPNQAADTEYYALTQYFKKDAANILLTWGSHDIVRHYQLQETAARQCATGTYSIYKNGVGYHLDIHQLRLLVCNTGVAVLSIELGYHGRKTIDGTPCSDATVTTDDINAINEYGRRISFPFLPDQIQHSLTADKIAITIGGQTFPEDFAATLDMLKQRSSADTKGLSTHYIMKPIRQILAADGCMTSDRAEANNSPKKIFIEHIADDRMYVCCVVADEALSARLHERDTDGSYTALNDEEIYKLAFIETSSSCHSETMRRDILTRCCYDRWIGYNYADSKSDPNYAQCFSGTLDFITHHSFVRLTSPYAGHVIDSFLNQYVLMAKLALIQRATLIALESECAVGKVQQISKLQQRYILAQQHFMLEECTVQEQGVEIFQMLRRELFVQQRSDSLEKRLQGLYELANLQHSHRSEILSGILTVIGLLITLIEILGI